MIKTSSQLLFGIFVVALGVVHGCGIEVGNPNGGKKGGSGSGASGTLTVLLADTASSQIGRAIFNLTGLSLVSQNTEDGEGDSASVGDAFNGKLDTGKLENGQTFSLTQESQVSAGDFNGMTLELNQDSPLSIAESDGLEKSVSFANKERGIFVPQSFTVEDGENVNITLHLDMRRSLKRNGDKYDFGPIAHIVRKEDEAAITGAVNDESVTTVCAYLQRKGDFNGGEFKRLPKGRGRGANRLKLHGDHGKEGKKAGSALAGRFEAKAPSSFDPNGPGVEFDGDTGCLKAFATTDVVKGGFQLSHIWPGKYTLRYYDKDGVLKESLTQKVDVKPGETVKVP